jgi:Zn-dependent M28 family amino/carboxypeptidase
MTRFRGSRLVTTCALGAALGCGSSSPAPDARLADAELVAAVDSQRVLEDLTAIAGNRPPGSAHWQTVQDLCADRFTELGYTVERHAYGTGTNVIGVRTGTTLPAERVVVSAHYDSVNNCAGADDNGSGVAGTLETARVMSLRSHARTLIVACWDEEERGLIGSKAYVARAKANGDAIIMSYVFEMIGYRSTAPNSQRTDPNLDAAFPTQTAEINANQNRGDFILVIHDTGATASIAGFQTVAADVGLSTIALPVPDSIKRSPQAAGLRRSDHAPFWDAGYPAVQLTDTADYRNPHYHCAGGADALADIDVAFATLNIRATVGAVAATLDR